MVFFTVIQNFPNIIETIATQCIKHSKYNVFTKFVQKHYIIVLYCIIVLFLILLKMQ